MMIIIRNTIIFFLAGYGAVRLLAEIFPNW